MSNKMSFGVLFTFFFSAGFGADANTPGLIVNCHSELASVRHIVEPLYRSTRTFANGSIRVIHLDTGGEPACCSSYLAILAPDPNAEPDRRQCKLLADSPAGAGFMTVAVGGIESRYDPVKGLLLKIPVERYGDGLKSEKVMVRVRVNQASGLIAVE